MKTSVKSFLSFAVVASIAVGAFPHRASAATIECDTETSAEIRNQETLMKTYTLEYWKVAQAEIDKLPYDLHDKGFVVGDFQFNNVGIYYDYQKAKAELIINDYDDAGQNYLIIDLIKYLGLMRKANKKIELSEYIQHYISGLEGKAPPTEPSEIRQLKFRPQYDFTKDYMRYIGEKRVEFELFDAGKMSPKQKAIMQHFAGLQLIKKLQNVTSMMKINNKGSSIGMERYEFMGQYDNGAVGLYEFKQLKCSATGSKQRQDLQDNFAKVKQFYSTHFPTSYLTGQHIYLHDGKFFLVREKKNNPIKKLDIGNTGIDKLQEYGNYYAYFLGTLHAKSANSKYSRAVADNQSLIIDMMKKISKIFKEEVKD